MSFPAQLDQQRAQLGGDPSDHERRAVGADDLGVEHVGQRHRQPDQPVVDRRQGVHRA
jgi:hypothetical protein